MRRSSNPGVVVAAISKEAAVKVAVEKKVVSAKTKARAALTVRRKSKEDFKDAIADHLNALADMIGRNVVLELISTDVDPSLSMASNSLICDTEQWNDLKVGATGKTLKDVVAIGIGGSFLGPLFVQTAMQTNPEAAECAKGRQLRL
ncbi:Glucose-6-phosphate isomerase, cytosolic [Ananas comosus]|uniref:Glucose-6-phosphate isomerase, cytosolic n=1 Tax=Ananas comosus TaxID=4615 RepID=A0A199UFG5_ANACO|nr:Glucose-6-phosphate isomerase, cytosolic [Ananas comosus]